MTHGTTRPSRLRRGSVVVLGAVFLLLIVAGPAPAGPDLAPPPDFGGAPDYLIPPVEPTGDPLVPGAPSATQTSEYMAGTVVYSVLFVESSGGSGYCSPADPQTENWSAPRQAQVLSELSAGMAFWPARTNRPALDFVFDNLGTAPTSCEPINRQFFNSAERGKWIADVLTAEGFPATPQTHQSVARGLVNSRRTALGADWGFLILVVDSLNDPDGLSPDNWRGSADLYGPMQYLSWDNGGWGIDRMNLVALHETGHTFGALDEYNGGCSTADTWGYLNVANASCNNGGITSDISVMGEGFELEHPAADVSVSGRAAIGWRNPSGPSGEIVDVVRTSTVSITPFAPDPTPDETPTYTASAGNQPFPPGGCNTINGTCFRTPSPVTISKVSGAEWRLDSGAWTSAGVVPSDGAFDEESGEAYTFTPASPVPTGTHTFATRSVNEFGHVSPDASDSLEISPSGGTVAWAAQHSVDFDADHLTDFGLYRGLSPADSLWFAPGTAGGGAFQIYFGATPDIPVPGDYDGDGKTDAVIYRPSTGLWYGPRTGAAEIVIQMTLGQPGDIPIPGDYDGDGDTDPAIYRPSTGLFFGTDRSGANVLLNTSFGAPGDVPVPRDYDGDGQTDPGIYRQDVTPEHYSLWYAPLSGGGVHQIYFGAPGDIPVPGDYDGDSKADSVIWRPSTGLWYGPRTGAAQIVIQLLLGQSGDVPIPGYYDSNLASDPAIFRPSTGLWFSVLSGGGTRSVSGLGQAGDQAIQKRPALAGGT